MKLAPALLEARQDPLHQPPRHGAGVGAGDAAGRCPRRHERRVHAAAPAQLRLGAADRRRVGRRVPRPRGRRRRRCRTTTSTPCRPRSTTCCRSGFAVLAVGAARARCRVVAGSVTSVTWELTVPGVVDVDGAVERVLGGGDAAAGAGTQGRAARRRRPPGHPVAGRRPAAGTAGRRRCDHRARPATGRAGRSGLPWRRRAALRVLRTHQWIEHDGNRREVMALPVAVLAPLVGA